jgi:hypothetical protein
MITKIFAMDGGYGAPGDIAGVGTSRYRRERAMPD